MKVSSEQWMDTDTVTRLSDTLGKFVIPKIYKFIYLKTDQTKGIRQAEFEEKNDIDYLKGYALKLVIFGFCPAEG